MEEITVVEDEGAMTREEVLAYIAKEFSGHLKTAKLEPVDSPASFGFVIDDALSSGGTANKIKARANYYALQRIHDGMVHGNVAVPPKMNDEIEAARGKMIAAIPKGE